MTESQLQAFLARVKEDKDLQEKLNNASAEEALAIAKQAGFDINSTDLNQPITLSDEEIENVAGGGFAFTCYNSKGGQTDGGSAGFICIDGS